MRYIQSRYAVLLAATVVVTQASALFAQPVFFTERGATVLPGIGDLNSRSASLADIDNDGDLDLLFQGDSTATRILMRNNFIETGTLTFTTIANFSNLGVGSSWSAGWGDYDGDGFVDVFVGQTNAGTNRGDVLRNNGDGTFTNTSVAVGLNDPGFHQNIAWSDINNDGYLDLIIGMEGPAKHEIYLQNAVGQFTPVGASVGFQPNYGHNLDATKSYGMAIADTDGDGDLDIYISTCNQGPQIRNLFFENQFAQTGVLSFIEIADSNGTQNWQNSYHSEFIDFDDDGDLDLLNIGADGTPTRIFRNDGNNQFTNMADVLGREIISNFGGDLNGGRAIDFDNDGFLDLYMHDNLNANGSNQARKLYRNDGNWNFTDVTALVGLDSINMGAYDSAWGDLDLDGDLDLIAPTRTPTGSISFNEMVFLSNASENGNNWFYLRLDGTTENTTAIGASVYATINEGTPEERTMRREATAGAGAFNQSDLPVHFGLGAASIIDTLKIVWPDGTVQILHDVAANQYLDLNFPGDFNGDHMVNAADLDQWRSSFGLNAGGDANGDGVTDGNDFLALQRLFGKGVRPAPAAGSVPEPATATLLLACLVAAPLARRRLR